MKSLNKEPGRPLKKSGNSHSSSRQLLCRLARRRSWDRTGHEQNEVCLQGAQPSGKESKAIQQAGETCYVPQSRIKGLETRKRQCFRDVTQRLRGLSVSRSESKPPVFDLLRSKVFWVPESLASQCSTTPGLSHHSGFYPWNTGSLVKLRLPGHMRLYP